MKALVQEAKGFDSNMDGEWINCKLVKDQFNGFMDDKKVGDEGI